MLGARQQRADRAATAEQRLAADAGGAKAGAVKRIPEAQRLEAPGRHARQLDRHFNRVRAAGREQQLAGVAGQRLEARTERFGQFDRTVAGKTTRRKAQRVELLFDGDKHMRVRVAHVGHVVAVEIHVAPARHVLDPDALGLGDGTQTRRRDRLVQKGGAVARQQGARCVVQMPGLPLAAPWRAIDVALALRRSGLGTHAGPVPGLLISAEFKTTTSSSCGHYFVVIASPQGVAIHAF